MSWSGIVPGVLDMDRGGVYGSVIYGPRVARHSLVVDIPASEISDPNMHIV